MSARGNADDLFDLDLCVDVAMMNWALIHYTHTHIHISNLTFRIESTLRAKSLIVMSMKISIQMHLSHWARKMSRIHHYHYGQYEAANIHITHNDDELNQILGRLFDYWASLLFGKRALLDWLAL